MVYTEQVGIDWELGKINILTRKYLTDHGYVEKRSFVTLVESIVSAALRQAEVTPREALVKALLYAHNEEGLSVFKGTEHLRSTPERDVAAFIDQEFGPRIRREDRTERPGLGVR